MKLDQLPTEMLMKIFSYVPAYREILRVNKLFYGIACKMNDSNVCVRIIWGNFEFIMSKNMSSYRCFQNLNRKITKLHIEGEDANDHCPIEDERSIIHVVAKFSSSIKVLQLANLTMDESTLIEMLSLIPNVEFLELNQIVLKTLSHSSAKRRCDDDLNLKKLCKLGIIRCDYYFAEIVNRLPAGVLTELRLKIFHWTTLAALLDRQSNIKKLNLERIMGRVHGLATNIFDDFGLESLELDATNMNSATLTAILSKHTKLRSLNLTGGSRSVVDDHVMNVITNLTELEILSMDVRRIPTSSVVKIRNLEKLRDLNLDCDGIDGTAMKVLAETVNSSIEELRLRCEAVSMDAIAALAKSAPGLKYFEPTRYRTLNIREVDAYLRHFNFIEVCNIRIGGRPLHLDAGNYYNPNLKELIISDGGSRNPHFYKWLPLLSGCFPNLRKFKLKALPLRVSLEFAPILKAFPKLESLTIRAVQPAIKDDLDWLCNNIGNLKYFSFGYIVDFTLFGRLPQAFAYYGFVCERNTDILNVAVDRYSLYCKDYQQDYA